jgi:hypothetical protein
MISENQNSLLTGKDTGNATNFRLLDWRLPAERPMAYAFLSFLPRNLTGKEIKLTGLGFQKSGN